MSGLAQQALGPAAEAAGEHLGGRVRAATQYAGPAVPLPTLTAAPSTPDEAQADLAAAERELQAARAALGIAEQRAADPLRSAGTGLLIAGVVAIATIVAAEMLTGGR